MTEQHELADELERAADRIEALICVKCNAPSCEAAREHLAELRAYLAAPRTQPQAGSVEQVESVARVIGETLYNCGKLHAPAGDPWTDGPCLLAAEAVLQSLQPDIQSLLAGERERCAKLIEQRNPNEGGRLDAQAIRELAR